VPTPTRQLCVLIHDGQILTDVDRHVPSRDDEDQHTPLPQLASTSGDPAAVLVAPQLRVSADPQVLLNVFSPRSQTRVDGVWTPLDDLAEDDAVVELLREVAAELAGVVERPARRPDWFRVSWYAEVEAWLDTELATLGRARTGPVEATKVWSISAVVRVPCDPAPVWFKASCRHFHAEPALTRLVGELAPEHAPPIVVTDEERAWSLMEALPGADDLNEDDPPPVIGLATARIAAAVQLRSRDHLDAIEAAGVPVRTLTQTGHQFDEIVAGSLELELLTPDELSAARAARKEVHAVLDELTAVGIPDTLVHGDLHTGNVAHADGALVLYDWSDAAVSHPFLDIIRLTERVPDDDSAAARAAFAAAWQEAYPDLDVARALELAEPANTIYQIVTFEQIQQAQEDASYWEMSGVVARMLQHLPDRLRRAAG
jgi:aminoglycoside phosphotransferase (APT) family kinase protein